MSKKMYFLISFVLVLFLAGNGLAYETMIWDNDNPDDDGMHCQKCGFRWGAWSNVGAM